MTTAVSPLELPLGNVLPIAEGPSAGLTQAQFDLVKGLDERTVYRLSPGAFGLHMRKFLQA